MKTNKNEDSESQELEESWDWNRPKKNKSKKIVGGGAFLSDEDESLKSNSPPKPVPKRKVLNGFMLSDEDENYSPVKPSLNVFLSNDEVESPKSTKKISSKKHPGFGLISSESEENEEKGNFSIYSKESLEDSMENMFTGNKLSKNLNLTKNDSVFKSKIEVNHEPKSLDNSKENSLNKSKDPFSLEFGKAHTLLESQISEMNPKFKPKETPSLYIQAKMYQEKILNSEGKETLKAKLEKVKMEVKSLDSIANNDVKISLAEDITSHLIGIFILESKSEGGPCDMNLQAYSKKILNEMRFGLPSLDKRLGSKAFANLLEEKFLFGEQEKYRLAFGTRFSQKKQIKIIIQNFFRIHHIEYYFNQKDINRPVKLKTKFINFSKYSYWSVLIIF